MFSAARVLERVQRARAQCGSLHVVVDSLTAVAHAPAASQAQLRAFVCGLQTLTSAWPSPSPSPSPSACSSSHAHSLLLVLPADCASSAEAALHALLMQSCDALLSLSPLATGSSKDVHGALSIVRRDELSGCALVRSVVHYRVTAHGVAVFAKGRPM